MQRLKKFSLDSLLFHMYHKGIAYFRTHSISGSFIQNIYLYILIATYYRINFLIIFTKKLLFLVFEYTSMLISLLYKCNPQ